MWTALAKRPRRRCALPRGCVALARFRPFVCLALCSLLAAPSSGQPLSPAGSPPGSVGGPSGALHAGLIEAVALDSASDRWASGRIDLAGGHQVVIPRNLLLELPTRRMTLQEYCLGDLTPESENLFTAEATAGSNAELAAASLAQATSDLLDAQQVAIEAFAQPSQAQQAASVSGDTAPVPEPNAATAADAADVASARAAQYAATAAASARETAATLAARQTPVSGRETVRLATASTRLASDAAVAASEAHDAVRDGAPVQADSDAALDDPAVAAARLAAVAAAERVTERSSVAARVVAEAAAEIAQTLMELGGDPTGGETVRIALAFERLAADAARAAQRAQLTTAEAVVLTAQADEQLAAFYAAADAAAGAVIALGRAEWAVLVADDEAQRAQREAEATREALAAGLVRCGVGHFAEVLSNRQPDGSAVAGAVFLHKGDQSRQGVVTSIDPAEGSFVLDGHLAVRLNDPGAVHSSQPGVRNGSPDPRYAVEPGAFALVAATGYPICVNGANCRPNSERSPGEVAAMVADPSRFEPLIVGDWVEVRGPLEGGANGAPYLSAHTARVGVTLGTAAGQPDFIVGVESSWPGAGWAAGRLEGRATAAMTSAAHASVHRVVVNGAADAVAVEVEGAGSANSCRREELLANTQACDLTGRACTAPLVEGALAVGQLVAFRYDWDDAFGASGSGANPALALGAARDPNGLLDPSLSDADNALRVFSPTARDVVYRTETRDACDNGTGPCFEVRDATGEPAHWGSSRSSNRLSPPLRSAAHDSMQPFRFEAIPWNQDRRLGPDGGDEALQVLPLYSETMRLEPFPHSGVDACLPNYASAHALFAGAGDAVPSARNAPTLCSTAFLVRDACVEGASRTVVEAPVVEEPRGVTFIIVASSRGRVRFKSRCPEGTIASAEGIGCKMGRDGKFRCRGSGLEPGSLIEVTCR